MSKNSISFNSLGSSGQVGNQLFQFAALINLANINNLKVLIPDPNTVEGEYFYDYFTIDKIQQKVEFGISKYRELIDSNFELNGYSNLFICDASIFDSYPASNIHSSVVLISSLFSSRFLKNNA